MDVDTLMEPMDLKVSELLKEVQVDYTPAFTELVDGTVSAIKEAINRIPDGLEVLSFFTSIFFYLFLLLSRFPVWYWSRCINRRHA